MTKDSVRNSR